MSDRILKIPGLWLQYQSGAVKIITEDIVYCHHRNDITMIVYFTGRYKNVHVPLKKIEEKLCRKKFYRCHRNWLINIDHIINYKGDEDKVMLPLHVSVPVSRRRRNGLRFLVQGSSSFEAGICRPGS